MPLKIYKRGEIWHYRGTVAGRRLRGSTETQDKAIAQRIAAERERREWTRHLDGPGATLTFAQAAMAYRQAEKSVRFLEPIEDFWRDTSVREITAGAIRHSAIRLYPNAKGATKNRQVIVPTQAIINFCAELDWCSRITVKRFPVETKTKEPVTLDWVNAFVENASPHMGALCLVMYGTGARISEAISLTWADVDLNEATVLVRQTKINGERLAHLPPRVVAALANIPSDRYPDDRVFKYKRRDSARPVWNNVIKRAGIKHLSFHCCRHGFATTMLHKGIDVVTVAKMGGWKDVSQVVKTYGHAMTDRTVTNAIFDTALTQSEIFEPVNLCNKRKIR